MFSSRRIRTLSLETLEARLNLSGLSPLGGAVILPEPVLPQTPESGAALARAAAEVGMQSGQRGAIESLKFGASATTIGVGTTAILIDSYSAIANCRLETIPGLGYSDIGYVSGNGAYVEYAVNVANGGTYALNFGLASVGAANLKVEVNGVFNGEITAAATGAWNRFSPAMALLQLPAGQSTIRFTSQGGSQYNLANLAIKPAAAPAMVTAVGDKASIPVTAYSAINNSRLEYQNGVPDIGYVSSNGAYVDYGINVASAGNYTLTVQAGSWNSASFDVLLGGTKLAGLTMPASYSWSTGVDRTATVYLPAGVQTLRFLATGGTQYNLFGLGLARQSTTPVSPGGYTSGPAPATPPAAPPPPASPPAVTITPRWMTSFTELDIVGTPGNDTITVTQSGGVFTITANGTVQQVAGPIGDIALWGGGGDDRLVIHYSVTVDARLYGGDGNDTLINLTRGNATIVSLGGGTDIVNGNYLNTNYWVDSADAINASNSEKSIGRVHLINSFYQPYATSNVSTALDGANLVDPVASGGTTKRLENSSFWGIKPAMEDINQGSVGDCYFLTVLQSLAKFQPDRLRTLAVDLGDGTYAVQFQRGGNTQYVRVDGDLPAWGGGGGLVYNRPGATGAQWASIFEKAYAHFRTGANSYGSLDFGWMYNVYADFGIAARGYPLVADQNSFYTTVSAALAAKRPVDIGTTTTVTAGGPFVARHTYSVVGVARDAAGIVQVTLRNPWGFDGFSRDDNPGDGWITVPYALLKANSATGTIVV